MGLCAFSAVVLLLVLCSFQPVVSLLFTPSAVYRNVVGAQDFCQLRSWFSANETLTEFINPEVGRDGSLYMVVKGERSGCVAIMAFTQQLEQRWTTDCIWDAYYFMDTAQITLDETRGILYLTTTEISNGVIIQTLNLTTGRTVWVREILAYYPTDVFAPPPLFDIENTGDIFLFTSFGQGENISIQFNKINHVTGNISILSNTTFNSEKYNWTANGFVKPSDIPTYTVQVTNSVLAKSTNGSGSVTYYLGLQILIESSYTNRGYKYQQKAVIKAGIYGFDTKNGTISYFQTVGYSPIAGSQPLLFVKGDVMYLSAYLASETDLELVGFNYVTRQILWRYPTTTVILTYTPITDTIYIIESDSTGTNPRLTLIDTLASERTQSGVVKEWHKLPSKIYEFKVYAVDANGNLYGVAGVYSDNAAFINVADGKLTVGNNQKSGGVTLGYNGYIYAVDSKSVRIYETCPPIDLSLSDETLATIIVGAFTFLFNFIDFILTKVKGGIGPECLSTNVKRWKVFLIVFQVLTTIAMTILGAVSQHAVISDLSHLTDLLSDIPNFRDNYVVPQCSPNPSFNLTDLCFCYSKSSTGTIQIDEPMCNTNACPAREGYSGPADCNVLVQNNCMCSLWFDTWSCGCRYPVNINDTYCEGTSIGVDPTLFHPKVAGAFDACYDHYHSILNLLWAVFGIHLVITTVTIILRLHSLSYLGSKGNGGFLQRRLPMMMTVASLVTTAALVITSVKTGLEGQVCTRPDTYDTSTIHDSRYIMDLFPGCAVNNEFYQLNMEGTLYDGVKTSLSVIGAKPGFSLLDLLHQIFS